MNQRFRAQPKMEYAEHLSRKFSIAVALAVLKKKPQDISTHEYVLYLQNNIKSYNHEQCMDIDRVSVTSQDFEDVIEDTMMTPLEDGILNNDLLLRGISKPAKTAVEVCQNKIIVQSTFIVEGHEPNETINNCNDLLSANIFEDQECGQTVDLYSQEPVGQWLPHDHENNGKKSINVDISKENTADLQESNRHATNHINVPDEQVFNFGQSQTDLFLTQTLTNLSVHHDTEEITPHIIEHVQDNDQNPVNSNAEMEKSKFVVALRAQTAEKISLNVDHSMPESCFLPTQTQRTIVTVECQENIELPAESANTVPSQTQNSCLQLLSQAIVSEAIEMDPDDEDYMQCGSDESERGVSFKVLQELENINNVLRELDSQPEAGIQSGLPDSGYRSDGHLSSSQLTLKIAERLEGSQLAQGARTLLEHVCTCGVRGAGAGAARAAGALARLAAAALARGLRPAFLDTLLRRARDLLDDVWTRGGDGPLSRDESVIRLMLLTECPDVAACTVEHLLERLDAFHAALTADPHAPYDAGSIDEVEAHCYSFHVLEMLLRAYLKGRESVKVDASEMFQEAVQETTPVPKNLPTSISDIWRKRWDPNHKPVEIKAMKTKDRKDILERCGAVLNKFIVDCMDKYSLISFAALECFNCLQSV